MGMDPEYPTHTDRVWVTTKGHGEIPTKGHITDVGWDLYISRNTVVPPHEFVNVNTDLFIALPDGCWGLLVARSSASRRHRLRVETGIIDPGFRGELSIGVWNNTSEEKSLHKGMRIAQLIIQKVQPVEWVFTEDLPGSDRGAKGFGSTGD